MINQNDAPTGDSWGQTQVSYVASPGSDAHPVYRRFSFVAAPLGKSRDPGETRPGAAFTTHHLPGSPVRQVDSYPPLRGRKSSRSASSELQDKTTSQKEQCGGGLRHDDSLESESAAKVIRVAAEAA